MVNFFQTAILSLTMLKPKPTIKINGLYYKYNAIAAVVYYNPQSIPVKFPINIELFADYRFLVQFAKEKCYIISHDLHDMYAVMISPWTSGIIIRNIICAYVTTITYSV